MSTDNEKQSSQHFYEVRNNDASMDVLIWCVPHWVICMRTSVDCWTWCMIMEEHSRLVATGCHYEPMLAELMVTLILYW